MTKKPRVIIIDVRNGPVKQDGSNINLPSEGQASALISIEDADVLIEISADSMFVRRGFEKGWVTMYTTKSVLQMNTEKAAQEKSERTDNQGDDLEKGDHPLTKFSRAWEGPSNSGTAKGGLKGY